jgi:hypothetical protein
MNEIQKTLTTEYIKEVKGLLINGTQKEKAISFKILTNRDFFVENYNRFVVALYERN